MKKYLDIRFVLKEICDRMDAGVTGTAELRELVDQLEDSDATLVISWENKRKPEYSCKYIFNGCAHPLQCEAARKCMGDPWPDIRERS